MQNSSSPIAQNCQTQNYALIQNLSGSSSSLRNRLYLLHSVGAFTNMGVGLDTSYREAQEFGKCVELLCLYTKTKVPVLLSLSLLSPQQTTPSYTDPKKLIISCQTLCSILSTPSVSVPSASWLSHPGTDVEGKWSGRERTKELASHIAGLCLHCCLDSDCSDSHNKSTM